ncbi:MAG: 30S ribosomal protein S18 [Anaerolineales bacterium]|nr:30S ribosomal protein S18 [Anaerolineales bacterium]
MQGLERNLFYNDDILRYLIVRADEATGNYDYKQFNALRDYVTEYGQIIPRRRNRVSAKQQRNLAQAIKRARHLALLPFVVD